MQAAPLGQPPHFTVVRDEGEVGQADRFDRPLDRADFKRIADDVREEAGTRLKDAGLSFDAVAHYARPVAAATAKRLFGIAPDDDRFFKDAVRAIFAHTFLNLGGDKAVEARALKVPPLKDYKRLRGMTAANIAAAVRRNAKHEVLTDVSDPDLLEAAEYVRRLVREEL